MNQIKGWDLSILSSPPAFHLCITSVHTETHIDNFISKFDSAIESVVLDPHKSLDGTLAIYGSATKVENSIFIEDVVNSYLHMLSKKQ